MSVSHAALITGCSSGIGRATALRLHAAGLPVYATARHVEDLSDLAAKGVTTLALDLTDAESMDVAVKRVSAEHGAVGILVNNAGYAALGTIEEIALDDARVQLETNVLGPARLIQLVLPGMREQHFGRIINLSSIYGRFAVPGTGIYNASKYAMEGLSDALRLEGRTVRDPGQPHRARTGPYPLRHSGAGHPGQHRRQPLSRLQRQDDRLVHRHLPQPEAQPRRPVHGQHRRRSQSHHPRRVPPSTAGPLPRRQPDEDAANTAALHPRPGVRRFRPGSVPRSLRLSPAPPSTTPATQRRTHARTARPPAYTVSVRLRGSIRSVCRYRVERRIPVTFSKRTLMPRSARIGRCTRGERRPGAATRVSWSAVHLWLRR
jgi:NAD(P)-dependent dehydrogenase (short-subunit alcohol dehydrogenase family)